MHTQHTHTHTHTHTHNTEKVMSFFIQEKAVWLYQDTFADENYAKSLWKLAGKLCYNEFYNISVNFLTTLTVLNLQHNWQLL